METVEDRGDQEAEDRQEDYARKDRIEAGEDLGRLCRQQVDRPHSADNHRRIEEGVDPRLPGDPMIAANPDYQPDRQRKQRQESGIDQPLDEFLLRQKWLVAVFEFQRYLIG